MGKLLVFWVAVRPVSPGPMAVTSPLLLTVLTVATDVVDEVQVDTWVIFWVNPSVYVPMARNCWMAPTGMDGTTVTDDRLAEVTVRVALP